MPAERPDEVDEECNRIVGGLGPGWGSGLPAWPDPQDASDSDDDIDEPAAVRPEAPPAAPGGSPAVGEGGRGRGVVARPCGWVGAGGLVGRGLGRAVDVRVGCGFCEEGW